MMTGNNYIGLMYSEVYGREMHAYRCIDCGKAFHRYKRNAKVKRCAHCSKQNTTLKIREANEKKKQMIIADAREQRNKELAEIIEDLFKPEIKSSYDEGFNAALMQIHDKVMF